MGFLRPPLFLFLLSCRLLLREHCAIWYLGKGKLFITRGWIVLKSCHPEVGIAEMWAERGQFQLCGCFLKTKYWLELVCWGCNSEELGVIIVVLQLPFWILLWLLLSSSSSGEMQIISKGVQVTVSAQQFSCLSFNCYILLCYVTWDLCCGYFENERRVNIAKWKEG